MDIAGDCLVNGKDYSIFLYWDEYINFCLGILVFLETFSLFVT